MNYPFNQHHGITMYDTITRTVCCLCIPTNIGVPLIITLWIAVSLFFASFSFMNKSPFFSYCNEPATIAFGVINVLFVIVLLYGYTLHIFYRSMNRYRQYAKLFTCFVSVILIDMFANCVLFAVQKEDYIYWCSARSNDEFQKGTAIQLDPQAADSLAFHCNKLHGIEAKFAFLLFTCAVFTFGFWASVIVNDSKNFVMIRPEISIHPPMTSNMNAMLPAHLDNPNASTVVLSNIPPSAEKSKDASIVFS